MTPNAKSNQPGPGIGLLLLLLALGLAGAAGLFLLRQQLEWAAASAAGWAMATVLALVGWLTTRMAMRRAQASFFRLVFGGMAIRLMLAGIGAALVIGLNLMDPMGFVGGLFLGVIVFQTLEVAGFAASARRVALARASEGA